MQGKIKLEENRIAELIVGAFIVFIIFTGYALLLFFFYSIWSGR